MSTKKQLWAGCSVVALLVILIAVLVISGVGSAPDTQVTPMGYENKIFSPQRIHSIGIYIEDWEGFLQTAAEEKYASCTVIIDNEEFDNVGIRCKGNSSLSEVEAMGSSRYSLKLEFDHYDADQSYHGLDKLHLNNLIHDNTMMKDYLTYQMMKEVGAAAPLCSYATVYVNQRALGLYLAVEAIEESFLRRNYGSDYGELYKPDAEGGDGNREHPVGERPQLQGEALRRALEQQCIPTDRLEVEDWNAVTPENLPELLQQLPGVDVPALMQALMAEQLTNPEGDHLRDVKLHYIDDDPASYPNIFGNAKTDITPEDEARLIQALKQLSTGKKLKNAVDIEAVTRYFAVHTFVCNQDSYTGPTVHNYYLYEKDGKLSMLPWDYNLAFGGMPTGDAASVVNSSIDCPVSGGDVSDRPMLARILENKRYSWLYRRYCTELLQMDMDILLERTEKMITPYVLRDPSKFCTNEEYEAAVETLKQFLELRTHSVQLQLSGKPANVDVGNLDLSHMGGVGSQSLPPKSRNKIQ